MKPPWLAVLTFNSKVQSQRILAKGPDDLCDQVYDYTSTPAPITVCFYDLSILSSIVDIYLPFNS